MKKPFLIVLALFSALFSNAAWSHPAGINRDIICGRQKKGVVEMGKTWRMLLWVLLVLTLVQVFPACSFGLWVENGNPLCTATADLQGSTITSDDAGGAIVAWTDTRSGNYDIYVQRIDVSGVVQWAPDGVALCTATDKQFRPVMTSDGAGGAIVAWEDTRGNDYDIYVQRVNGSGVVQWAPDGVALCTAAGKQFRPVMTSDGAGGAIVAWQDDRGGGSSSHIYVQRVNASGVVQWAPDGVALCTATYEQSYPRITSDGAGGAIVAWHGSGGNLSNHDIYVQRVNAWGGVEWTPDGVALYSVTGDLWSQTITSDDAGGAIVAWSDTRGGSYDIYVQRVNGWGGVEWAPDGVALCTAAGRQEGARIVSDGAGGAIVAWQDARGGGTSSHIYVQRVNGSGVVQWAPDGVALCTAAGELYPEMTSDGAGGAIVAWDDYRSASFDVYVQKVNASGVVQWAPDGVALCTASGNQFGPAITTGAVGEAIVTWLDSRSASNYALNYDIYAQRVERNGYWGYPAASIKAVRDVPGDQGGNVNVAWDASRLDPWPEEVISKYTVWRAITPERMAGLLEQGAHVLTSASEALALTGGEALRVEEVQGETFYWELMSEVKAYYLDGYSKVVSTLFDSTSVCNEHHYFQVIAHGADPSQFWVSAPDSGYSVDNLSPVPPSGLAGGLNYQPAQVVITWQPNKEGDLSHYAVYKGEGEGFVPSESNRIGTPSDTSFVDTSFDPTRSYYKVSAWDIHENESEYALLRPEDITGASGPPAVPAVSLLEQNAPNPFNPMTVIRFAIAEPGLVTLIVYDVAGRPVRTLVDGMREASRYDVTWNGRDDSDRGVASGVYVYVLDAPGYSETKKMVLIR
ncbi:MAG: T9SS type A sorting domain-containing protein [Candidatus Eisenbacteria bacterium]|nr:T9SS type A sorting domain-containing protein [Candidatus Eisenbacteria bacterium]